MAQYSLNNIRRKPNSTIRRWFSFLLAAFTVTILLGQAKVAQGCASFFVDPATDQQICLDDVLTRPEPATESPRTLNSGWSEWASLNGLISSKPAVGINKDGRLEVFGMYRNTLWHRWQTVPNGPWSDWEALGGPFSSAPTVVMNKDGRLEVFALGGGELWHIWQTVPNGPWSERSSLGGASSSGGPLSLSSAPAVGVNKDGRLEVFVGSIDRTLWRIRQTTPNGNWSSWSLFGDQVRSAPAVGVNEDGRLELFVNRFNINSDGEAVTSIWHYQQTVPNGPWSEPSSLNGLISSTPVVSMNKDGRLEVFARSAVDNTLLHIWQTVPNGPWSEPSSLGGLFLDTSSTSGVSHFIAPAVGTNKDGRLEVFITGEGNELWHIWQTVPNGAWSDWSSLGGSITYGLAVGTNKDGRLEVFARSGGGGLLHIWQTAFIQG